MPTYPYQAPAGLIGSTGTMVLDTRAVPFRSFDFILMPHELFKNPL